jgi:hypothetical protein
MSIKQPSNRNFLSPVGFSLSIKRLPHVEYFVQEATIPAVGSEPATKGTPFVDIKFQPDRLNFNEFVINLILDEDMKCWEELFLWKTGITFPHEHKEYKDLVEGKNNPTPSFRNNPPGDIYSDISLIVYTNKSNPNFEYVFKDAYPITLGEVRLKSTENDINYLTFDVSFHYLTYSFNRIP